MAGQRNAGHREAHAARFAAAGETERLAVACDWFRASAALLRRRRPPRDVARDGNTAAAGRLIRDATTYLATLADAIDRGDYDAK